MSRDFPGLFYANGFTSIPGAIPPNFTAAPQLRLPLGRNSLAPRGSDLAGAPVVVTLGAP